MHLIQKLGLTLFIIALAILTLSLGMSKHKLTADNLKIDNAYHKAALLEEAGKLGMLDKTYNSNVSFISDFKSLLLTASSSLANKSVPSGTSEWDYKLGDWKYKDYTMSTVKSSGFGLLPENAGLFFWLTFGLGILGGILFVLPQFIPMAGIKNDGIYHNPMTSGLQLNVRKLFLTLTIVGIIIYGFFYMNKDVFWPLVTVLIIGIITYLVLIKEKQKDLTPTRSASPDGVAWLGIITGIYLIAFYILLYWKPEYLTNWILMVDPISRKLSGNPASEWFLYGFLYTVIMMVMGTRMIAKYRHNKYQMVRTASVIFFQTAFAFLLPEVLMRLNQPYFDFKSIWPLNYTFFFDYNITNLLAGGNLGIFMLVWGIVLTVIGVPVITYFFGKRWYCSWVCGCGGLAETLGDPYRQLSDKSVRAWKFERYIIHGVLVFAVVMTIMVLYTYFTGSRNILFLSSDSIRGWYGFLIGAGFAGVVGTGFYPLMGNRTWCRFGCPLAAYLGLVQKFQSRFRITTNGGQCISCGNCSTYCEMGIDVRAYAQKGQDIVRSSCVGCGICSAVCPRGVLRLENSSADISSRTDVMRTIHISEDEVTILM